jgi:DNA mismatch repair protein MutL
MSVRERTGTRKINLLPQEVYNRIAAGEVVERPASVLKELIENSLDAGAATIDVRIAGAGRSEISVGDDGEGMSREDLLLAFERHATSKVSAVEDLSAIRTLGFRGEALSAIASVSRLEAASRLKGSLSGYRLRIQGGKIQGVDETGTAEGTTLTVRDLFFNTPARKKFLKSKNVENGHLLNVFKRFALAYPQVRWSLILEGKSVYKLPQESLKNRILAVFSEEFAERLFYIERLENDLRLSGFIGAPGLARKSRGDQYFFVNRRWVQDRLMGHAIATAYGTLLEAKTFPFYALSLDLAAENVDVNVHPAKSEVKFRREQEVYQFLHHAIQEALHEAGLTFFPSMQLKPGETVDQGTGEISPDAVRRFFGQRHPSSFRQEIPDRSAPSAEAYQLVFGREAGDDHQTPADPGREIGREGSERTQVYQFHNRYIVTEIKGGIALIDQHAAHERILYEKALKALTGNSLPSQQLLFPKIIELDAENAVLLQDVLDDLQKLGVDIREFGDRSFALEALPTGIREGTDDSIVLELLDELKERGTARSPGQEQIASAFACRAAIKFGQTLTLEEMNALIDQLFATQFPFTCPHGRPTLLQLTIGELDRRFGRA